MENSFITEKKLREDTAWKQHIPSHMIEDEDFLRPKYQPQHPLELETRKFIKDKEHIKEGFIYMLCLLYTSPSPRDVEESRMPSSA